MRNPWREEQLSGMVSRLEWLVVVGVLTSDATNLLNDTVDHLLANGVVTTSIYGCQ